MPCLLCRYDERQLRHKLTLQVGGDGPSLTCNGINMPIAIDIYAVVGLAGEFDKRADACIVVGVGEDVERVQINTCGPASDVARSNLNMPGKFADDLRRVVRVGRQSGMLRRRAEIPLTQQTKAIARCADIQVRE